MAKVSNTKVKELPKGVYYHCTQCKDWVTESCGECTLAHGQVVVKMSNEAPPKPTSALQLGQFLIALSLVGLVYLSYFALQPATVGQIGITLIDFITIAAISAMVIGLVMWLLKAMRGN